MSDINAQSVLPNGYLIIPENGLNPHSAFSIIKRDGTTVFTFDLIVAVQFYAKALLNGDIQP